MEPCVRLRIDCIYIYVSQVTIIYIYQFTLSCIYRYMYAMLLLCMYICDCPIRHVLKQCRRISQQVVHGRLTSVPDMMLEVSRNAFF